MSEYRNFDLEDVKTFDALSEFYLRHIDAMTQENLHSKFDIAWELCYRDNKNKQLEAERDALQARIKQLEAELEEERQENASLRSGDDYERGAE